MTKITPNRSLWEGEGIKYSFIQDIIDLVMVNQDQLEGFRNLVDISALTQVTSVHMNDKILPIIANILHYMFL